MSTCNTSSNVRAQPCVLLISVLMAASVGCGQDATRGGNGGPGPSGDPAEAGRAAAAAGIASTIDPTVPTDLTAAIEKASDPSAAVEAYAKAHAAEPNNPRLSDVYVRRMVSLGAPQLAEKQAESLVAQNPRHGIGWAVLALCSGAANDTTAALDELASAVRYAPDDPFVQYTAGQLLGWYDVLGKASELPAGLPEALEKIKQDFNDRPSFTSTYQAARGFYQQQRAAEEKGAASAGPSVTDDAALQFQSGGATQNIQTAPQLNTPPMTSRSAASSGIDWQPYESSAAPSARDLATSSEVVVESPTPVVIDDTYVVNETVEPTYVETPVYVPTYYPTYVVPSYYSTYPGWSVGLSFGWGWPWWDCGTPWWSGSYGWRGGWSCYPGWGWKTCGYYRGWGGAWGWHGCGVVPHGRDYVRCDRDVHRHLGYGLQPGHRPYTNRSLVGVANHGNGAHLAAGFHRPGGASRAGYLGGDNAGRGDRMGSGRSGTSGGYGATGGRSGSYPSAGAVGPSHRPGGPDGVHSRAGIGGASRGGDSLAAGAGAHGGRTASPQVAYPNRAGPSPSGSIGRTGPSQQTARSSFGSPANRSGGSVGSAGRGSGSAFDSTRPRADGAGPGRPTNSSSNANRAWPLARGGDSSRSVAGASERRPDSAALAPGSRTTGSRSAGASDLSGTRSATSVRNSAGRGTIARSTPGVATATRGGAARVAPSRSVPRGNSSRGALSVAPRTSGGSRSMMSGGAPRTAGTSSRAFSLGGMRGSSGGSARALSSSGLRSMSGGGRSFSGGALHSGGLRGGGTRGGGGRGR